MLKRELATAAAAVSDFLFFCSLFRMKLAKTERYVICGILCLADKI